MTINERNQLRKNAGLPLLDAEAEQARLAVVQQDAAFERYFLDQRDRVAHLWADRRQGWLARAAIWADAKRRLRREFEAMRASGTGDPITE